MNDINQLVLIGRLTQDLGADERSFGYVGNGQARANFSIAVNHSKKNGEQWVDEVDYFSITVWGKTAENLKPYLTKGKQVCVVGHLKQDRWEKDGQKQSRVSIVADSVELLGGRSDSQNSAPAQSAPRFVPAKNEPAPSAQGGFNGPTANSGFTDGADFPEDIPF